MVPASNPHNYSQTHMHSLREGPHHRKEPCFTNTSPIEWLDITQSPWRQVAMAKDDNTGACIKESRSTHSKIPYARMHPHRLSIKHQTHNKHRGMPSGNQQPIRIISPMWWKVCSIHNHCNHERSQLSPHMYTHTSSSSPVSLLERKAFYSLV